MIQLIFHRNNLGIKRFVYSSISLFLEVRVFAVIPSSSFVFFSCISVNFLNILTLSKNMYCLTSTWPAYRLLTFPSDFTWINKIIIALADVADYVPILNYATSVYNIVITCQAQQKSKSCIRVICELKNKYYFVVGFETSSYVDRLKSL